MKLSHFGIGLEWFCLPRNQTLIRVFRFRRSSWALMVLKQCRGSFFVRACDLCYFGFDNSKGGWLSELSDFPSHLRDSGSSVRTV